MHVPGPAIIFHRLCVAGESTIRPDVPSDDEDDTDEDDTDEDDTDDEPEEKPDPAPSPRKKVKKIVGLVSQFVIMYISARK